MRRRIWVILATLGTIGAGVTLFPVIVEHYAEGWLHEQGMPTASIEDLDFNPFTGELVLSGLDLGGGAEQRAQLDYLLVNLEMLSLPQQRLEASAIILRGARLDTTRASGSWHIGPLQIQVPADEPNQAASEAGTLDWGFGCDDLVIEAVELNHTEPALVHAARVNRIHLGRITTWEPDGITDLLVDVDTDAGSLSVQATATPLAAEPALAVSVEAEDLDFHSSGFRATTQRLRLRADISVVAAQAPAGSIPHVSGTFAMGFDNLALTSMDPALTWLNIAALEILDGRIAGLEEIAVGRLELGQMRVLAGTELPDPVATLGGAIASGFSLRNLNDLRLTDLSIQDLILTLHRDEQGAIAVMSTALTAPQPVDEQGGVGDQPGLAGSGGEARPFTFAIENLEIGGDSAVRFTDASTQPAFSSTVAIEQLRVRALGNIDPETPAQLTLGLREGEHTRLNVSGTALPFREAVSADLKLTLEDFDLHKISPYLPAYHIERGRLSVQSVAVVNAGELEVTNDLSIDRLKLAGKTQDENALAGQGMAMPLDVALNLLRDGDDRISLALPITGKVADPNVNTGDIVRIAMQSAIQKAALSYVKNALQPLGAILLVARVAGSAARPRFEPIEFVPGNSELPARAEAYLEKIGDLMSERNGLALTFCGVATARDNEALVSRLAPTVFADSNTSDDGEPGGQPASIDESVLIDLAEARGDAVRGYLTRSRSIDPERLFACRPSFERVVDAVPRVEITL